MTDTKEVQTEIRDAVILDLAARLLDTARGLDAAVKVGGIEEYSFDLLQSELMGYYRDAGRIASRVHGG